MTEGRGGQANLVTITIDGQDAQVPAGASVVDAAREAGVEIPIFCHHPKLEPVGMCRMCLVEVGTPAVDRGSGEVQTDDDGNPVIRFFPTLQPGCTMRASEGMVVNTQTEQVTDARKSVLEFLLTSHPLDCPVCDKGGECPLQNLTLRYGPGESRFNWGEKYHFEKPIALGPLIKLDRERCVLCARCIRFEEEIAGDPCLGFENRGRGMEIVTFSDPPFDSYFSGNTSDICPVGALTTQDFRFEARAWELVGRPSVCGHCPVGCNTMADTRFGRIERMMPRENDAVNEIWLCDKGRFAHHHAASPERIQAPLLRREGQLVEVSWDEALGHIAERLKAKLDAGDAQRLGGIASAGLANEDLYLFGRLMRGVLGSANLDHLGGIQQSEVTQLAGAPAETQLTELGAGDAVLVAGLDVEEEAPLLFLNLMKAISRGASVYLMGGRPQKLDPHVAGSLRYRYGAEESLATALLAATAKAQGDGRPAAAQDLVAALPADAVQAVEGQHPVGSAEVEAAASALAGAERLIVLYGREAAQAGLAEPLAALATLCGGPGTGSGVMAVGPRANSQGAADMGLRPGILPGYADTADAGARARLSELWPGLPPESAGQDAAAMLDGGVDTLYVLGADPAGEDPLWAEAIEAMDFVVVHELFMTETAKRADVVLPAQSHLERSGSFTNYARRVQIFQAASDPVGQSRADWLILCDLALRFGEATRYADVADVFEEIAQAVPAYAGLSYADLGRPQESRPIDIFLPFAPQTEAREVSYHGTAYRNDYGIGLAWPPAASDGDKAALSWRPGSSDVDPVPEPAEGDLLLLPTRRLYDAGRVQHASELLRQLVPEPYVEVSAFDAAGRGLAEGARVEIATPRGRVQARLKLRDGVTPGTALAPEGLDWEIPIRALTGGRRAAPARIEALQAAQPQGDSPADEAADRDEGSESA